VKVKLAVGNGVHEGDGVRAKTTTGSKVCP